MGAKVFFTGLLFLVPTWTAIASSNPQKVPFWLQVVGVTVWGCSFMATLGGAISVIWTS